MNEYLLLGLAIIIFGIGFGLAFWWKAFLDRQKTRSAQNEAALIVQEAEHKANALLKEANLEAKDRLLEMKNEFDNETKETRSELKRQERRLIQKEENVDKKIEQHERKDKDLGILEKDLEKRSNEIAAKEQEYETLVSEQKIQLEKISSLTAEQAKELLLRAMENEARYEGAKLIKRIENEAKEEADKKAKKILATSIQRYAADYVAERTVSVVQLPSDEMKGRIIGREGRNIRALESATGIDLIIDDTPEAVILSGFNPVRREIARQSLIRLISDGRIHPARIEDVVKKVTQEVDTSIKEAGEQAAFDLGVHGIDNELIKVIGRLKFRTSYSQNVLQHSVEVGFLSGIMAAELG
ncbi:MAG: ribonuclease Y, partial [Desulfosarcinaceae bacterium]